MNIEIDINAFRQRISKGLDEGMVRREVEDQMRGIVQKHRAACIQELDAFAASVVVSAVQHPERMVTTLRIQTPDA